MMQIGDTICLDEKGEIINFTEKCGKALNEIHYELKSNSEDKGDDTENNENINYGDNDHITTRHMGKKVDEKLNDREKRKEHQEELLKEKNEDFKRRLDQGENFFKEETAVKKKDYSNLKCYESPKQFPPDLKDGKMRKLQKKKIKKLKI